MYELPKDTPFGTIIMQATMQPDNEFIKIIGSQAVGYLVHKDRAKEILSNEAIKQGVPFGDFLSYPAKTTGLILAYELPEQGFFSRLKKAEQRTNLMEMFKVCPEYVKERNIQLPTNGKSKSDGARGKNTTPTK